MRMENPQSGGFRKELADKLKETRAKGGGFIKKTLGIDGRSEAQKILKSESKTDEYQIEKARKEGEFFDKNIEKLNQETILELIQNGQFEKIVENLNKFKGLKNEIAEALIGKKQIDAVVENIESFEGLGNNAARELIRSAKKGGMEVIVKNIGHFKDLSDDMLWDFQKEGYDREILDNLDIFKENSIGGFDYNLERFLENTKEKLGQKEALSILERSGGKGGFALVKNLEKFEGLNHSEIAQKLIDTKQGYALAQNLEKFEGLNHSEIAQKLIDTQQGDTLAKNLEKFKGLDHENIISKLFENNSTYNIPENMKKFKGQNETETQEMNVETAEKLIKKGDFAKEMFIRNLSQFSGLNMKIALELMKDKYIVPLIKNLESFKLSES